MSVYRIGVVGLGDISDVYINNLKLYPQLVSLEACAARSIEKAKNKADQHGFKKAYASPAELIADPDVDIVLNLTPPESHYEINLAALEAGKHVHTEKPLAATYAEGKHLLDRAKELGLRLGCAPDTFMGGRLQTCRKLIDDGVIGEIVGASAFCAYRGVESFHPSPDFFYKQGAGPLLDIGPYYMTALLSLLGPVESVSAMARRTFPTRTILSEPLKGGVIDVEVDTHVTGNLQFASGAIGTFITSFDCWDSELPRMEIYGSKGTICIPDIDPLDGPNLFGGEVWLRTEENYRWYGFPRDEQPSDWKKIPIEHPFTSTTHSENSRGIGLIDLVLAMQQGREERASGAMALHSLEVMERILDSAHKKKFFDIETKFNQPLAQAVDYPECEFKN
jgi:predicted dehydrogenase